MSKLSACIALLVCLSSPVSGRAQAEPATRPPLLVGVHGGFNFGEGDIRDERFGLQASIPLVWRLTADPVFGYLYNFPDDPTGVYGGSAWETYFTLREHPFEYNSFLSLGYGFTVVHASLHTKDHTFSDSATDGTDVGVIGLTPEGASPSLRRDVPRGSARASERRGRTSTVRGQPPHTVGTQGTEDVEDAEGTVPEVVASAGPVGARPPARSRSTNQPVPRQAPRCT